MFEKKRWGEISELKYGKSLSGYRESNGGQIPVYGTNGQIGFTFQAQVNRAGVIVGRKGAYRGVHYSARPFSVIDTAFYLVPAAGISDLWAYYSLKLSDINGLDSGSAIPSTTREAFASMPVLVPPFREQLKIAEVLGALDDKIAANTTLVNGLDEHMSAMVAASSRGARKSNLEDIVDFHNRKRVPLSASEREQRRGVIPYYGASGVFGRVDQALFDFPMVLVGEDGSVINTDSTPVTQYVWGPAWVNNHAHVLTGKGVSTELLYQLVRRANVSMLVTGAVQPKVNMGNLKRLEFHVPEGDVLVALEQVIANETAFKRSLVMENRTLAELRDTLLPELMSGRLQVKDAEQQVGEAN